MSVVEATRGLEAGLVDLVLQHPVAGELAALDVRQNALHLGLRLGRDDPRAGDVLAIFGRVGDGVVHVRDAAFIDQVDDQLHFVQAFEIGHFRRVTGFDQGFEPGADQFDQTTAQDDLLTEQVGFALFLEGGFDDAGLAATIGAGIGQGDFQRIAGRIAIDGHQRRHAAATQVFGAHSVARPFRRDHEDVEIGAGFDQVEMNVQAMRETDRGAFLHIGVQFVAIDVALQLVRGQHHDDVGPSRGFGSGHALEARRFGLLAGGGAFAQRDDDVADAAVPQVHGMGMPLAAEADDGDLLGLDQINVRIAVVIDAHD